jgi:hypothetical protein
MFFSTGVFDMDNISILPSNNGLETNQSKASFILEQVLINSIILKTVVSHLSFVM